jgi:23S rRNA (adenine2503-C2)-methyltransferase
MNEPLSKPDLRSLTREELRPVVDGLGEPGFRVDQLCGWLYRRVAGSWEEMSNLPLAFREALADRFLVHLPKLVRVQGSGDTTRKFLWELADGALIESVLIPASPALYGEPSDRHTLCVSTQVGCAYGCRFCASGLDGWKRDLGVEEIVGQVLAVERDHRLAGGAGAVQAAGGDRGARPSLSRLVSNLVIMGMGEPLANYDALLKALGILNAPWGCGIGARKITVSTSGLVPEIRRLARQPLQFGLAISLHGATDVVRGQLMPVNRRFPLSALVPACEEFVRLKGRMITLEFILIAGVNDDLAQARQLVPIARRLHAKVNLIPYNAVDGLPWQRPGEAAQEAFLDVLTRAGIRATLRREKGHDIDAACGQLRLRTERDRPAGTAAPPLASGPAVAKVPGP